MEKVGQLSYLEPPLSQNNNEPEDMLFFESDRDDQSGNDSSDFNSKDQLGEGTDTFATSGA